MTAADRLMPSASSLDLIAGLYVNEEFMDTIPSELAEGFYDSR